MNRQQTTCTCDRLASYTFAPACPVHGEGTLHAQRRHATACGDWSLVDALDGLIAAGARCPMCGAEPGRVCTVISGGDGLNPGDVRPTPHFYRAGGEA